MAKKLYSAEETEKAFEALPQTVKDLLYSFEMTSIFTKIGEKHGLHIDQMDILNTETGQVMMGLTETKDFPGILVEDLEVDQTKADAIAGDVNSMLFTRIREAMKGSIAPVSSFKTSSTERPPLSEVLPKSTPTSTQATPLVPEVKPSLIPMVAQSTPSAPAMSAPV